MEQTPVERTRIEELGGGIRVQVSGEHKFGTDALLLSEFAGMNRPGTACDLGCGCGIVSLLWYRSADTAPKRTYAVDIQPEAAALARRSAELSGLDGERYTVLEADLRELRDLIPRGSVDLVVCNPPYWKRGSGRPGKSSARQIARQETCCTIEELCAAAAGLLRFKGRLCLCHIPWRMPDIFEAMRGCGIEPKRMQFAQKDSRSAPWLVMVEGRLGSKPSMAVASPAVLTQRLGAKDKL